MNGIFENFIKGPLTSLIGVVIMCAAAYGWWIDHLTDWQGGAFGIIGFALLFMRDNIPALIMEFVKTIIAKFGGGKTSIITLLLMASFGYAAAQTPLTDAALTTQSTNTIKNKAYTPQNMHNMLQALVQGKQSKWSGVTVVSTTTYTITDANTGSIIVFSNVSGCTVSLSNTLSNEHNFTAIRAGGQVDFVATGSAVLNSPGGETSIELANGVAGWVKRDATNFQGFGQLGPSSGGGGGGAVNSVFSRTGDVSAASGDYDASQIDNAPSGNISSTDVANALSELDAEKQPLDGDLSAIAGMSATGLVTRSATSTMVPRTITGTANEITVTDGNGVSGNPTIAIATNPTIGGANITGIPQSGVTNLVSDLAGKWNITGSTTVTNPTIIGNITWTQPVSTSGSPTAWTLNGGAHTNLAQAVEAPDVLFNLNRTVQFIGGGTFNKQRAFRIIGPTYSATLSTTIGDIATLGIRQPTAGPNVVATNNSALIITDGTDEVQIALNTHNPSFGALTLGSATTGKDKTGSIGAASKTTGTSAASGTAIRFFGDLSGATNGAFQFTTLVGNTSVLNGAASIFINASPTYLESSSLGAAHSVFRTAFSITHAGTTGNRITGFLADPIFNITGTNASTIEAYAYRPTQTALNSNSKNVAFTHNSGFVQWESILSPAQITSDQTDYNPTGLTNGGAPNGASIVRASSDASRNIYSLAGGFIGRLLIFGNVGTNNIVLKDDDGATGTASMRFQIPADYTVLPEEWVWLWYDGTSNRWRMIR